MGTLHRVLGAENRAEKGDFEGEIGVLGVKKGLKWGSLFTFQSLCKIYKVLIPWALFNFSGGEMRFPQGEGVGVR